MENSSILGGLNPKVVGFNGGNYESSQLQRETHPKSFVLLYPSSIDRVAI